MAKKLFNFRIDAELHKKFKRYCFERDLEMTDLLTGYIERVVDGEEKESRKKVERKPDYDPLAAIRNQYND